MSMELDLKNLEQAFQGRDDLQGAIRVAAGMCKQMWQKSQDNQILGYHAISPPFPSSISLGLIY